MAGSKVVPWRVSVGVYNRFQDLIQQIDEVEDYGSDYWSLVDDLRSLPGFPAGYDEENDLIQPVIVRTHL